MEQEILDFLIRAKKKTYAGKGAEVKPTRPGSHDLSYEKGDLLYYDTYLGGKQFAGEEALRKARCPIWSMNYVGRVLQDGFSGDFLKEALSHVPVEKPYRGPEQYISGDYRYEMKCAGDFSWFQGEEAIYYRNEKVYECFFHGGAIS